MAERPVRALRFSGFGLGIWRWPVINILLEISGRSGKSSIRGTNILTPMASPSSSKATYSNIEEYSIWEDHGGVIRVRVKRKAERG